MTQSELDELIKDINHLARQVGAKFIPDPRKMKALLKRSNGEITQ